MSRIKERYHEEINQEIDPIEDDEYQYNEFVENSKED